eukprot:2548423-Alexandrium_andersonii.AAC.1
MALEPHRRLGPPAPPGLDTAVPSPARARSHTPGSGRGAYAMHHDPLGPQTHQLAGRTLAQGARRQPYLRRHARGGPHPRA